MKNYLLLSNTTENKLNKPFLDLVSYQLEKHTNKKLSYRELSPQKAYEWELCSINYDIKVKKIISNFLSNYKIGWN